MTIDRLWTSKTIFLSPISDFDLGIAASNAPSVTATADTNVGNAGRGLFNFEINLYTDETMTTEMILNPSIAVGSRLNFGVEAGKYKNIIIRYD